MALVAFVVGAVLGMALVGRRGRAARLPAALGVEVVLVAVGGRPPRAGRRVATVTCIFLGAVVGGQLQRHSATWSLTWALVLIAPSAVVLGRAGWPAPVD